MESLEANEMLWPLRNCIFCGGSGISEYHTCPRCNGIGLIEDERPRYRIHFLNGGEPLKRVFPMNEGDVVFYHTIKCEQLFADGQPRNPVYKYV